MYSLKRVSLMWGIFSLLLLVTMLLRTGLAEASGTWKLIPGANPSATYNGLRGVAAVTVNDVWAVGAYSKTQNTHQPLIEHWNGSAWTVFASPSPDPGANLLSGVSATSAQDAWAVGNYFSSKNGADETLIDHWNGTKWSVASSPDPSSSQNSLNGVTAISASNVWAVGDYQPDGTSMTEPLIEHWNGCRWTVVSGPKAGVPATLLGVAASSPDNVWAVGHSSNSSGNTRALIEHWDGSRWSIMPSANPGAANDILSAVTAVSAHDIWAVGQYEVNTSFYALIEHWDGTRWSVVSSPGSGDNFYGVTEVSANNIWAVGQNPGGQTLIEHWNGSKWSVVSSPNEGSGDNALFAVARVPSTTNAWAVGQFSSSSSQTIFEYYQ